MSGFRSLRAPPKGKCLSVVRGCWVFPSLFVLVHRFFSVLFVFFRLFLNESLYGVFPLLCAVVAHTGTI
jgi:hypothetical protein